MFNLWMFNQKPVNGSDAGQQAPVIIGGGNLGNKTAPFSVTYKVYDPNNEAVTVLEKLNGVAINTRPDAPQKTDLTFEITQALWDALTINANHSITIEAINESELSASRYFTFYRQNVAPATPEITHPVTGSSAVGPTTIEWTAATDPDAGQIITYKVFFSTNGGATKTQIADDVSETSLIWDVTDLPPGDNYQIYVSANDGIDEGPFGVSGVFRVLSTPKRLSVPQFIEVKDIDGNTVALLSPKSDGLDECWIEQELNGISRLEFTLALTSEKWAYLTPKNRIHVQAQNRTYEFVIANPDAIERSRDGKKLTGKVLADETWILLGKKYQTISNDPQNPNPPWGAVIIVSGGSDLSGARYPVGSAGHVLYALLEGTGWELGTVDVGGTYDLETEKESVLANINKVQELWGGYLVWDSQNKTVSLRSEESWQNYSGFQIRYGKNLKAIQRYDDTDIVTRLRPFGENDLNIAAVNDGKIYLDNNSYSDELLEDVWYNQDISDQTQLKEAATKYLAKVCKPRHKYVIDMVDLRVLEGYQHEVFALGDMVDVIDPELGVEGYQRIIKHRFNVFQPWLCEMDIGDPLEKIAASLADSIKAADYIKSQVQPNPSFQNLIKAIINTAATMINGANGDYTLIDGVSTWFERDVNGNLTGSLVRITPQGLIISSDGGQAWDLAINGAGINANMVNTGTLNAALVNILSAGGDLRIDGDGIKMYDADDNLRINIGKDALGNYLSEIIGGALYSTTVQTGEKGENRGIIKIDRKFLPEYPGYSWGNIIFNNQHGNTQMEISSEGNQPQIYFYDNGTPIGEIRVRTLLDTKELLIRNEKGIDLRSEIGGSITIGKTNDITSNNGIRAYSSNPIVLESPDVVSLYGKGAGSRAQVNGYEVIVQGNKIYLSGATEVTGNLRVLGTVHATGDLQADGSKPAIIPTANYGRVRQYASESPEIILFDRGRAQLENGKATIYIDPIHLECIEPDTDLTPWTFKTEVYGEGEDIRVIEWGENYFKVKESNGGESNRSFGWWFYATRKNYAGIRLMEVID